MNTTDTLDKLHTAATHQKMSIETLQASLDAWKEQIESNCIRYCLHRSRLTTDALTGNIVCATCGKA